MPLTPAVVLTLARQCAPGVAPETLLSVVRVESGLDPLVISINRPAPSRVHPTSLPDAVATATRLIALGSNIDLGLGQINSANLAPLGLGIADAFEPCLNLRAAGAVLKQAYQSQAPRPGREQAALRTALSIYNTGRADRGFRNGYVAKVSAAAAMSVPALEQSPSDSPSNPAARPWDVFGQGDAGAPIVFTSAEKDHP
jgi:type IV secretion system protein VirB1